MLAHFYAAYDQQNGRNWSIRPDDQLLAELEMDKKTYTSATRRLVDKGVLKFSGLGGGCSITVLGVDVSEADDLLEDVLPVPSSRGRGAREIRGITINVRGDFVAGAVGHNASVVDSSIAQSSSPYNGVSGRPKSKPVQHLSERVLQVLVQMQDELGMVSATVGELHAAVEGDVMHIGDVHLALIQLKDQGALKLFIEGFGSNAAFEVTLLIS